MLGRPAAQLDSPSGAASGAADSPSGAQLDSPSRAASGEARFTIGGGQRRSSIHCRGRPAAKLDSPSGVASGAARFAIGGGCLDDGIVADARDDLGVQ